ncbi:unnamed protein product [Caenorhabditis auriculariae]|uniref:KIF21A/B second helical domain-containing protein n=1 Tax=Caenorhabditis auriculariae TaxID=2777116 RepID=A0A8S1HWW8_9PELO|nr:unnamed protein product [Caenorhabditis auriculariae]
MTGASAGWHEPRAHHQASRKRINRVFTDGSDQTEDEFTKQSVDKLFDGCETLTEAKYLMQHLFDLCLEKASNAAKTHAENKESAARIQQLEQQSFINEQLLTTVIEDKNLAQDIEGLILSSDSLRRKSRSPSQSSARGGSVSPSLIEEAQQLHTYKVRRHTATADELLYPQEIVETPQSTDDVADSTLSAEEKKKRKFLLTSKPSTSASTSKTLEFCQAPPPPTQPTQAFVRNTKLRSTVAGLPPKRPTPNVVTPARRGGLSRLLSTSRLPAVSEDATNSQLLSASWSSRPTSLALSSSSTSTATPSSSPSSSQSRDANGNPAKSVFARISPSWDSDTSAALIMNRKQSRIVAVKNGMSGRIISRTHTLEGHSKGVLSVASAGKYLVTGSKDRTAKLWDLEKGQEIRTLGVHPNNVHLVRFVPKSHFVLTISMYQVRVWDYRTPECVCVKVLNSSGQTNDEDTAPPTPRQNTIPFLETMISAADVEPTGRLLFTSFSGDVRIWNLDRWASFGRLTSATHSPKSEVSCLSTTINSAGNIVAYTGSRDHYVKTYEVTSLGGEGVYDASVEYNPPHYDNVTCVHPMGGHLFTASKDLNIMKFSLVDNKRDHLELRAHQQYIQSLASFGPKGNEYLVSACKEGTMKFWDVASSQRMRLVEDYPKAHSDSINEICSTPSMLFTASGDGTVGFWKSNIVDNL